MQFCFKKLEPAACGSVYSVGVHTALYAAARKPATIRRNLATIARAQCAAELFGTSAIETVRLGLKEMDRAPSAGQRQARSLGWSEVKLFLETASKGIRADRKRALLCVAYDAMAPRGEPVALDVQDRRRHPEGKQGRRLLQLSLSSICQGLREEHRRSTAL
jgi:hypothetical protein